MNPEKGLVIGLAVFCGSLGLLATVAVVLVVIELAAQTAAAVATAVPAGVGISLALRKAGK